MESPSTSPVISDNLPSAAIIRLTEERRKWRSDHPYGFVAVPTKYFDGRVNLRIWDCSIPGPTGTPWAGGQYKVKLVFHNSYPETPPVCRFIPPIFHPNVIPTGLVRCWHISSSWVKTTSIKEILVRLQTLLIEPIIDDLEHYRPAAVMYKKDNKKYNVRIRNQARRMARQD